MAENCYVSRFLLAKENNTQSLENSAMASMVILGPSASLTFSMSCEIEAILAWNQQVLCLCKIRFMTYMESLPGPDMKLVENRECLGKRARGVQGISHLCRLEDIRVTWFCLLQVDEPIRCKLHHWHKSFTGTSPSFCFFGRVPSAGRVVPHVKQCPPTLFLLLVAYI